MKDRSNWTDLDADAKSDSRDDYMREYTGIEFISEATLFYNCHSYAWYSRTPSPTPTQTRPTRHPVRRIVGT